MAITLKRQTALWALVITNSFTAVVATVSALVLGKAIKMIVIAVIGFFIAVVALRHLRKQIRNWRKGGRNDDDGTG